jgi:formylglycine-generating enzyme required for sulfatase activity
MGSRASEEDRSDDETQHRVTLTQGFWMADTACTQDLWVAVMGDNPAEFSDDLENPVENVSWDDVQIFLQRINDLVPEMVMRLPSEAEWEYACRAGTTSAFSFGMEIDDDQVNYDSNIGQTVPVKALPANPWGLYQMHGNVWEWCQDWYDEYPTGSVIDPSGVTEGADRVLRGGSWLNDARLVRSALRFNYTPDDRRYNLGFRLAHP